MKENALPYQDTQIEELEKLSQSQRIKREEETKDGQINSKSEMQEKEMKNKVKRANKKIEFNEPDKSVTKILLLELRNIKKSLIESSKDIEKVFELPLSHVKLGVSINFKKHCY